MSSKPNLDKLLFVLLLFDILNVKKMQISFCFWKERDGNKKICKRQSLDGFDLVYNSISLLFDQNIELGKTQDRNKDYSLTEIGTVYTNNIIRNYVYDLEIQWPCCGKVKTEKKYGTFCIFQSTLRFFSDL